LETSERGAVETSRVHLIGAGGSGMSALGRLLISAGHAVSGSDASDGPALRSLERLGANIRIGHDASHVSGAGRVVITPVITSGNEELKAARAAGLEVRTRAEALGELLSAREVVAVAGSHGKTTTGAMLALVLRRAGRNPGHYLGAASPSLDGLNANWSPGAPFVLEACEAFGALEAWRPAHCLVTNLDDEHLEHYGGQDGLVRAFRSLVARTPDGGVVALCGDDPGAMALAVARSGPVTSFGLGPANDVRGLMRLQGPTLSVFEVLHRGDALGEVSLPLAGLHNVRNALGVIAMALELAVPFGTIASALAEFQSVERRWNRLGQAAGVELFDDFAHHPIEIDAVLKVARANVKSGGKLVVAFATRLHSGVARLAQRFAQALSAADLVLLAPLPSPGELAGGYEVLAGALQISGAPCVRLAELDQMAGAALDHLASGDVFVSLGPAEIGKVGSQALAGLADRERAGEGRVVWSISQGRAAALPEPACLANMILDQARRRPDAPAVQCGGTALTYGDLMRRAAAIADALVAAGLEAGDMTPVSLDRTAWRAAAFVGALLAGGVYLPVDPGLPPKRQRFMLADARARVAIAPAGSVEDPDVRVIDPAGLALAESWDRVWPALPATSPAYVIYTSGTTGQPKGVVIEHGALANFASTAAALFEIDPGSRVSHVSAFGFDVAVGEMAMTLAAGACLVVPPEAATMAGGPLGRLIRDARVSHLSLTPSALATLPAYDYPCLTHVIVAGEACPPDLAERWGSGGRAFFNAYGPTEATVLATVDRHVPGQAITIGRAMDNTCAFILDEDERPVRRGANGELWLSGAGVARGYFRRKDLTAERFRLVRPDGRKAVRAYRTGDLAAMLPDGRIRYLGRADDQVKLRGFRIELGEVEACLRSHAGVRDAAVALRRNGAGQDILVAYVAPEDAAMPPAPEALAAFVGARLPAHMTPSAVIFIPAIPLSANGKRDRTALPDPPRLALLHGGRASKPPGPGIETQLHDLFRRELAIEDMFGVRETLIDLGADSLKTANLFLAVEAEFRVELTAETAATANTIELLAIHLRRLLGAEATGPAPEPTLAETIARKQLTYLAAWTGTRRTPESLIFTRGAGPGRPPLFWCFQGDEEHERLAAALGPGVTVHGMRSGHLIFRYEPSTVGALAARYVQEIVVLQPIGPIRIGGNCQGGIIAQEIVARLVAAGREVEALFLLDPGRFPPAQAPVSLIFGVHSEQNPYLAGGAPERVFEQAYPAGYSVAFLPGAHGLYFESPALEALAAVIGARLRLLDGAVALTEPA